MDLLLARLGAQASQSGDTPRLGGSTHVVTINNDNNNNELTVEDILDQTFILRTVLEANPNNNSFFPIVLERKDGTMFEPSDPIVMDATGDVIEQGNECSICIETHERRPDGTLHDVPQSLTYVAFVQPTRDGWKLVGNVVGSNIMIEVVCLSCGQNYANITERTTGPHGMPPTLPVPQSWVKELEKMKTKQEHEQAAQRARQRGRDAVLVARFPPAQVLQPQQQNEWGPAATHEGTILTREERILHRRILHQQRREAAEAAAAAAAEAEAETGAGAD